MALTTCKHCGKKVSDTVDVCIHCGKSISKEVSEEKSPEVNNAKTTPPPRKFYGFSDKDQDELEKEFIKQDPWAMKYIKGQNILSTSKRISTILSYCALAYLFLGRIVFNMININAYSDSSFYKISAVLIVVSIVLLISYPVIYIIEKVHDISSAKRMIYWKKMQKWLLEEKNVEFVPKFEKNKQMLMFEDLNLDNYNF